MLGKKIGQYRILEKLGEGGMGTVFKALDERLDRPVALKFLLPAASGTPEGTQRLLQEARAASALNHPNVITVYEIGDHDGTPFIAAEFVDGRTLHDVITPGGLDPVFVIGCARQVAEGLRAAHARGVIHRDLKPQNIMLSAEGRVKLMDFGLALLQHGGERITRPGSIIGTALYMSPEQIEGKPIDHRSDLFSFGVVLYEMLTGRPPFEGAYEVAIMYSIVNVEPVPLEEVVPGIPEGLRNLVLQCLRKSPAARPSNAGEIIARLSTLEPAGTAGAMIRRPPEAAGLPAPAPPERRLFGRVEQLGLLRRELETAAAGRGRTVFVRGEAGIGKTHLVAALREEARARGMTSLWGRALFQEAGLPYHPFVAALSSGFQNAGTHILELLSERAAGQGIPLAGRLASLKAFLKLSPVPAPLQNKEQLWDAVLFLLNLMGQDHPVVLVIDDMQWADRESVGLFSFLARNAGGSPLLLIGLYRSEPDPGDGRTAQASLAGLVRQLRIEQQAEEISLERLSEDETAALLACELGGGPVSPQLTRRIQEITEGNPLFASELVSLMKTRGILTLVDGSWRMVAEAAAMQIPERVQEVIEQRLAGLSAEDREVIEAASCDGQSFTSDILAACLHSDRLALLKRLQALEREHALIRHEKTRYRFDHPLIRQVLYEGMLPELREEYHRLIARWLMDRSGSDTGASSRIAHHLVAAGQDLEAPEYLLRAADHARSLYAHEEARDHYALAREILATHPAASPVLLLRAEEGLGDVALASGRTEEALEQFSVALRLSRAHANLLQEIKALRKMAATLRILGRTTEAVARCGEALAQARTLDLRDEQIECLNTLAFNHAARGEYEKSIELSDEALRLAREQSDARNTAVGLSNLGLAAVHTGEYLTAAERLTEARAMQEYIGDRRGLATTLNYLALVHHRLGHFETALESARLSYEMKKSIADLTAIPGSINIMGDVYRDLGDLGAAVTNHEQSLALARQQGNRGAECDNLRDLGADHLAQGDLANARRRLEEALAIARSHGYTWYETRSCITLAELALRTDAVQEAGMMARRGLDLARSLKAKELTAEALWKSALVLEREGKSAEAVSSIEEALETVRASGHALFLWQMNRDLSRMLLEAGDPENAGHARERALALVREIAGGFRDEALRQSFAASSVIP